MANNASVETYERLIAAVQRFRKRNLEIAGQLCRCSDNAIKAMNGDTTSEELQKHIHEVIKKMGDIETKAETLQKALKGTYDSLKANEQGGGYKI